ncbi:IS5/IS1182 family transposase, partial [Arthrobacter sp. TMN-49]
MLPPDIREWLPADHLALFVVDVLARLDTTVLHGRSKRGGTGRQGYDPDMLLGLWLYASAR